MNAIVNVYQNMKETGSKCRDLDKNGDLNKYYQDDDSYYYDDDDCYYYLIL